MQSVTTPTESNSSLASRDELIDAVLGASRALVAVAARSVTTVADNVTLTQYRALVELTSRGPQRVADLASALSVDRSTATRMSDRLVRRGLASRRRLSSDRRTVLVSLTPAGRKLITDVTRRRRAEIATILARMPGGDTQAVFEVLRAFSAAAGQAPDQAWSLGWDLA